MSHITTKTDCYPRPVRPQPRRAIWSLSISIGMLLACLAFCACSSGYEQAKLGPDSKLGKQIQRLVADLHQAGPGGMDQYLQQHGAPGLTADQQAALRATMTAMLQSEALQLVSVDQFGQQVLRAGFSRSTPQGPTLHYLLLIIKDGKPFWAGMN